MPTPQQWHASLRRAVPASREHGTGEIRILLALFNVDEHQADIELILSRVESEQMHAALSLLLTGGRHAVADCVR